MKAYSSRGFGRDAIFLSTLRRMKDLIESLKRSPVALIAISVIINYYIVVIPELINRILYDRYKCTKLVGD